MITSAFSDTCYEFRGLSTDTKPIDEKIGNGSIFFEMDTQKIFMFNKTNTAWVESKISGGGGSGGSSVEVNTGEPIAEPLTSLKVDNVVYGNASIGIELSDIEDPTAIPVKTMKINNDKYTFTLLTSPNGTKYSVKVDDSGNLSTEKVL